MLSLQILPKRKELLMKQEALSVTLDAWSTSQNQGVLAINASYVDEEFEWCMNNLASKRLESKHKSEVIVKVVQDVIKDYGLDTNAKVIINDNNANKSCT